MLAYIAMEHAYENNSVTVQHFARAQSYLLSLAKGDRPDWLSKNVVGFINSQTSPIILQRRYHTCM